MSLAFAERRMASRLGRLSFYATTCLYVPGALAGAQQGAARGVIDGAVTDSALRPVAGAVVSISQTGLVVLTGDNGRFRVLAVPAGPYDLHIRKLGFGAVVVHLDVMPHDTVHFAVELARSVVTLDSVRVTANNATPRLAEFAERRAHGGGQFLTEAEIEKRGVVAVSDLLSPLVGVRLTGRGQPINTRYGSIRTCFYQVFLDDVLLPTPNLRDNFTSPKNVAGIEVYTSIASVPLRYASVGNAGACGVILVWTKSGGS